MTDPSSRPSTTPSHAAHNESQRRYYSGRDLPRMDPRERSSSPYTQRHVDAVAVAGSLNYEDRICDVGCGPGKYTVALAARGFNVEGLDLTPRLVEDLRSAGNGLIEAHLGDLCDPPPSLRGRFDAVVGFMMLHHIDDLSAAFHGVRSLLTSGGRAVFLEPNPLFPGYYAQIAITPGMRWRQERGILRIRPHQISRLAAQAGFEAISTQTFGAFPPFVANRPRGARIERLVEAVPGWSKAKAFQVFSMTIAD